MKPISSLKVFRSGTTAEGILAAFLSVISNPKRHLRGPRLGLKPGNGKIQDNNANGNIDTAVCGCAMGILDTVTAGGPQGSEARVHARDFLNAATYRLFPGNSYVNVSDNKGLRAIRKVARAALEDVREDIRANNG